MQDLEKKFEKYGPVREARIVRNPRSGESRGFGFLIMENDDDVDRVRVIFGGPIPALHPPGMS